MAVVFRKIPKYRNRKVRLNGHVFDSRKEAERYVHLSALEKQGVIKGLEVHPRFPICVNGVHVSTYVADFSYFVPIPIKNSEEEFLDKVVEDVKSKPTKTPLYKLKKKLVEVCCGIKVKEV